METAIYGCPSNRMEIKNVKGKLITVWRRKRK